MFSGNVLNNHYCLLTSLCSNSHAVYKTCMNKRRLIEGESSSDISSDDATQEVSFQVQGILIRTTIYTNFVVACIVLCVDCSSVGVRVIQYYSSFFKTNFQYIDRAN